MLDNYLKVSVNKTKVIIINFRQKRENYSNIYINGEAVDIVNEYKYLGTIIDDKLHFDQHANAFLANVSKECFFLGNLGSTMLILHVFVLQ